MVIRKESQGISEFTGKVESVDSESGANDNTQYHIIMDPIDIEVGGKTGKMHEWIPLSPTSNQEAIAKGSVMDLYLRQVEIVLADAKKAGTVDEALGLLVGKKFKFQKMELGRAYQGNPAREYAVPVQLIE
ncbi:hypothetical protein GOV11_04925 [Candidatus Woesearchaeota archaeon]|nr:hypothetical protein [Candidatus Woesearchaeota archaeon]